MTHAAATAPHRHGPPARLGKALLLLAFSTFPLGEALANEVVPVPRARPFDIGLETPVLRGSVPFPAAGKPDPTAPVPRPRPRDIEIAAASPVTPAAPKVVLPEPPTGPAGYAPFNAPGGLRLPFPGQPPAAAPEPEPQSWPRMVSLPPANEPVPGPAPVPGIVQRPPGDTCLYALRPDRGIGVRIGAIPGPGACGAPNGVELSAVKLPDGRLVKLSPSAKLRCDMAAEVIDWIREDFAPAVAATTGPLATIHVAASYTCRSMNNLRGTRMSEHGRANALDIRALTLIDGRVLDVLRRNAPTQLQAMWKTSVCKRFATVLGPGSDGFHENHIHVDLAPRRAGYQYCRWRM